VSCAIERPEIQEGTVEPTDNEQQAETSNADTAASDIEAMVEEELLVEEISIDGMCGVY
jgi:mycofactocin precursor